MGSNIEIKDPYTKQPIKKPAKPFMVNCSVLQLEQNRVILPTSEDTQMLVNSTETKEAGSDQGFVQQMRNFSIERYSVTGLPTYSQGNEHALTAWMLSITAFFVEMSDIKGRTTITAPKMIDIADMLQRPDGSASPQGQVLANAARTIGLDEDSKEDENKKRIAIAKGDRRVVSKYYGKRRVDRTSGLKKNWWSSNGFGGSGSSKPGGRGF